MTVTRGELERIAELAGVALDPAEEATLVKQLEEILDFVAQLQSVSSSDEETFRPGPVAAPLRPDVVNPIPMRQPFEAFAPEIQDGFLIVPRTESMGDNE